jgi:uncharacterized membrane protein YhhN
MKVKDFLKKHLGFIIIFLILLSLDIFVGSKVPDIKLLTKGLIVASILVYYIIKVPPQNKLYILALIFALIGDLFLAVDRDISFELGLGSFLVMQLLYISIFKKGILKPLDIKIFPTLQIVMIFIGFMVLTWTKLGAFFWPVAIYGLTLSIMTFFALHINSYGQINLFWIGAFAFMISDFMLAINKFVVAIPYQKLFVMSTYGIAQLFICLGFIYSYERAIKSK